MPASILIGSKNAVSNNASATIYWVLGNAYMGLAGAQTAEADAQIPYRTAGRITSLYTRVTTNDRGTSTFRLRKNTANGNNTVSITASTTGEFQDVTNSDSIAAGDLVNTQLTTGAGGTTFTITMINAVFNPNANNDMLSKWVCNGVSTAAYTGTSATFFNTIAGTLGFGGTESSQQTTMRTRGTLKNMSCGINANTRSTASTILSRKNTANGALSISIGATLTGVFEDTTHSDSLVSGDLVNTSVVVGTGVGSLTATFVAAEFITTNGRQQIMSADASTVNAAATNNYSYGGNLSRATEADSKTKTLMPFFASFLGCVVTSNTVTAASTLKFRINGANGNQSVSITASTTGLFEDSTHTDVVAVNTEIDDQVIGGATGTSLSIRSRTFLLQSVPDKAQFFGAGI